MVGIIAQVIAHPAAGFAVRPTLTGATVLLRPFAFEQDAPALREMLQDPEAVREWSEPNRSCNFRTIIGPRGRDRGLGTEAIRLFLGYGLERLGLRRISLDVLNFNPRAKRVYEKLGFVTEGVLREEHRWGDEWIDITIMSMLAHEWARHRGRPERRASAAGATPASCQSSGWIVVAHQASPAVTRWFRRQSDAGVMTSPYNTDSCPIVCQTSSGYRHAMVAWGYGPA